MECLVAVLIISTRPGRYGEEEGLRHTAGMVGCERCALRAGIVRRSIVSCEVMLEWRNLRVLSLWSGAREMGTFISEWLARGAHEGLTLRGTCSHTLE